MKNTIFTLKITLAFYAILSFILLEYNPLKWEETTRGILCLLVLVSFVAKLLNDELNVAIKNGKNKESLETKPNLNNTNKKRIQSIVQDVIEGRKDNNEATIDILGLSNFNNIRTDLKTREELRKKGWKVTKV